MNASSKQDRILYHNNVPILSADARLSDTEWSTASESSVSFISRDNSPASSPFTHPTFSTPFMKHESYFPPVGSYYRSSEDLFSCQQMTHPSLLRSVSDKRSSRRHIPRPANAFMLFRSDYLKQGHHTERRQQNLSRLAGEAWNGLSADQRKKWQDEAAIISENHQRLYPSYRFTPSPRGSSKSKSRQKVENDDSLTLPHVHYMSQIASSPPKRTREPRKSKEGMSTRTSLPPSVASSPAPSPQQAFMTPLLPPAKFHLPSPRQAPRGPVALNLPRPPSAASSDTSLAERIQDMDITPTATSFRNIQIPSLPYSMDPLPPMTETEHLLGLGQLDFPYAAIDPSFSQTQLDIPSSYQQNMSPGSFMQQLYGVPQCNLLDDSADLGTSFCNSTIPVEDWEKFMQDLIHN